MATRKGAREIIVFANPLPREGSAIEDVFPNVAVPEPKKPDPPIPWGAIAAKIAGKILGDVLPVARKVQPYVKVAVSMIRCPHCTQRHRTSKDTQIVLGEEYTWACPSCGILSSIKL